MTKIEIGTVVGLISAFLGIVVLIMNQQSQINELNMEQIEVAVNTGVQKIETKARAQLTALQQHRLALDAETKAYFFAFSDKGVEQNHHLARQDGIWDACFLTRISGKFEGAGEVVEVRRINDDWYLYGTSLQPGVQASAVCIKYKLQYGTEQSPSAKPVS